MESENRVFIVPILYRYFFADRLQEILELSSNAFLLLISRVKEMGNLSENASNGIIKILIDGNPYDIQASLERNSIILNIKSNTA